ncbi:MAG: hypothetical protein AN486_18090 [Anabaena sp. AL93]|nr:MAG: hypothetical protein AN486_18090 [Anabaena sp. AL93]
MSLWQGKRQEARGKSEDEIDVWELWISNKAKGKRQEARVKRVWAILRFFTQFGFIVFSYLIINSIIVETLQRTPLYILTCC